MSGPKAAGIMTTRAAGRAYGYPILVSVGVHGGHVWHYRLRTQGETTLCGKRADNHWLPSRRSPGICSSCKREVAAL